MSIVETATPGLESTSIRARVSGVLPLVGIGFALIVNTAWVAFLGYCMLKLI